MKKFFDYSFADELHQLANDTDFSQSTSGTAAPREALSVPLRRRMKRFMGSA
jgi:hypothetical protein